MQVESSSQPLDTEVRRDADWRRARKRRDPAEAFKSLFSPEQTDDLTHGQRVIVTARWILVLGGLLLTLWNPAPISELRVQLAFILILAVGNFYLHAQLLRGSRVWGELVVAASLVDITVISVMIGISDGRFDSNAFAFYFPAILAFAVAFPTVLTLLFAGSVIAIYSILGFSSSGVPGHEAVMVMRLLMLAAVAISATVYWRTERSRRRVAADAREELLTQIHERNVATDPQRLSPAAGTEGS